MQWGKVSFRSSICRWAWWTSAPALSADQSSTSRTRKIATNVEWLRETENYAWRKDATGRVAQLPCCHLLTAHLTEEQQSIAKDHNRPARSACACRNQKLQQVASDQKSWSKQFFWKKKLQVGVCWCLYRGRKKNGECRADRKLRFQYGIPYTCTLQALRAIIQSPTCLWVPNFRQLL